MKKHSRKKSKSFARKRPIINKSNQIQDAVVSIGLGTAVGAGTSAVVGGMGLTVAGTGVAIGLAPMAAAGAVVGTAAYGVYKLFGKK